MGTEPEATPGSDQESRWRVLREHFEGALDIPAPERKAWLADRLGHDPALLAEVLALLAEEDRGGGVLSRAPVAPGVLGATGVLGSPAAHTPWDPESLVGATVGGFSIVRLLARGGMGVVYAARQHVPNREVALKTLQSPRADRDALRRFRLEVEVLGLLQHPGIAQIHEGGTLDLPTGPVPFLAMELVPDARDLVRYAVEQGLDLAARCRLLRGVCEAVHEGHRRGIVHRDLKPANVLVDGAGRTKVIDFGLARVLDDGALAVSRVETIDGRILGTLDYMSPEHVSGRAGEVDVRSDVYSLGCILYELAAGRTPRSLATASLSQAVRALERDDVRVPRDLPRPLRGILTTALAHDPAHRYGSAVELAQDLARFERGEPVVAQGTRAWYAVASFSRRHRALLTATFAVIVALSIGLWRTLRERAHAESEARTSLAISSFLTSMMRAMDAYRDGVDARIVDMLAEGAMHLDEIPDPRARAVSRAVIGEGFLALKDLPRAREHLEPAVRELAEVADESESMRLQSEAAFADLLERQGEYEASLALSRRIVEVAGRAHGEDSRAFLYARSNIPICLGRLGRFDEAEAMYRRELADLERSSDRTEGSIAAVRERLANTLLAQHRPNDARAELVAAFESLEVDGATDTLYATSLTMSVARIDLEAGQHEAAARGFEAALEQYIARGDSASNVFAATLNLVQAYTSLNRFDDARAELERANKACAEVEPTPGRLTHMFHMTDARTRLMSKDFEGAFAAGQAALALGSVLVPTGHPSEPVTRVVIAQAEAGRGHFDAALAVLREGEANVARIQGPASREVLRLRRSVVDVLARAGRQEEAVEAARAMLAQLGPEVAAEEREHWRASLEKAGAKGL